MEIMGQYSNLGVCDVPGTLLKDSYTEKLIVSINSGCVLCVYKPMVMGLVLGQSLIPIYHWNHKSTLPLVCLCCCVHT